MERPYYFDQQFFQDLRNDRMASRVSGVLSGSDRAVNKLQSQMVSSIHSLSQKAGIAALNGSQDSVADMVAEYEKGADMCIAALRAWKE